MSKYFSPSTRGFYDSGVHGARTMLVPDLGWVRPTVDVEVLPGQAIEIEGRRLVNYTDAPIMVPMPDMSATWPRVEVSNPACRIPVDSVEISDEEHAALVNGQSPEWVIGLGENGTPELQPAPPPTPEQLLTAAKASRAQLVDAISVTTNSGAVFDGDEVAQGRMVRAIVSMSAEDTLPWVMSNNSVALVSRAELQEALRLAGAEMARIWVAVYEQG